MQTESELSLKNIYLHSLQIRTLAKHYLSSPIVCNIYLFHQILTYYFPKPRSNGTASDLRNKLNFLNVSMPTHSINTLNCWISEALACIHRLVMKIWVRMIWMTLPGEAGSNLRWQVRASTVCILQTLWGWNDLKSTTH